MLLKLIRLVIKSLHGTCKCRDLRKKHARITWFFLVQDDPFIEEITINICMCCNIHVLLISRVLPSCALLHFSILE